MPRRNYSNSRRGGPKNRPHTRSSGHARVRPKKVGFSPEFVREFGHLIVDCIPTVSRSGFHWTLRTVGGKKMVLTPRQKSRIIRGD